MSLSAALFVLGIPILMSLSKQSNLLLILRIPDFKILKDSIELAQDELAEALILMTEANGHRIGHDIRILSQVPFLYIHDLSI